MIRLTILGTPQSKANSRDIVMIGKPGNKRPLVKKSDKALDYEHDALRQIPPVARQRLEGPVRVAMRIFYPNELQDLDESLILDILQDRWKTDKATGQRVLVQSGVYRNDRQVRRRFVDHAIDARNPRAEILVIPLAPQQGPDDLFTALEEAEREAAEAF